MHASAGFAEDLEGGEGVAVDWIFHATVAEAAFVLFVDLVLAVVGSRVSELGTADPSGKRFIQETLTLLRSVSGSCSLDTL